MKLDQLGLTILGDQTEGVHTKTVKVSEGSRDTVTSHCPQKRMQSTGLLAEEVPSRVVRSRRLRDLIVAPRLHSVDQVRELDSILDEEYGDVVANDV